HAQPDRQCCQPARRRSAVKIARDPWREQPQGKREDHVAAGGQRPPIESYFADGPDQRADQDRSVAPESRSTPRHEQGACDNDPDAGNDIVGRAAEGSEPDTTSTHCQTDQSKDDASGDDGNSSHRSPPKLVL